MMVLTSHLIVPIEWIPYPQKEYGYCRIVHKIDPKNEIQLVKVGLQTLIVYVINEVYGFILSDLKECISQFVNNVNLYQPSTLRYAWE
jgi:hypothetical protein